MEFFETFNVAGIKTVVYVQDRLPYSAYGFFADILKWSDTAAFYYGIFPIICAFDLSWGISLLWALISSEWIVQMLLWVLPGDRPMWWLHETPYYLHKSLPYLRQFPLSCETGPGTPSHVVSVNAAFHFILVGIVTSKLLPRVSRLVKSNRQTITTILWASYAIWVGLIMMSQTYMATHFPHQVFLGAIIGVGAALWVRSRKSSKQTRRDAIYLTLLMLALTGSAFGFRSWFGEDPTSVIKKGIRWCMKREYIQIDEVPSYSVFRVFGLLLGLQLATTSPLFETYSKTRFTWKMKLSSIFLAIAAGQATLFADLLIPDLTTIYSIFYSIVVALYAFYAFVVLSLLPRLVMMASGVKPSKLNQKKI